MSANKRQVGGEHYKSKIQHWDYVASNNMDYFQGQITKYVARWKDKNGIEDLKKAQHFLEKYIELAELDMVPVDESEAGPSYVNQDPDISPPWLKSENDDECSIYTRGHLYHTESMILKECVEMKDEETGEISYHLTLEGGGGSFKVVAYRLPKMPVGTILTQDQFKSLIESPKNA